MKRLIHSEPGFAERLRQLNRTYAPNPDVVQTVRQILAEVKQGGDEALVRINNRFSPTPITRADLPLKSKPKQPSAALRQAIERARRNVEAFHKGHLPKSWMGRNAEGARVGESYAPLDRVGIYVPGGTAPLISTALMTIVPARVAGVKEIVVCTPAPVNPDLHYAILRAGATEVYPIGGAQAVAAMAYGTTTIRPVRKVFGPGNAYVTEAKRQVFGAAGVDLLPGPSEIAVLADGRAEPAYVAADLLAQAEHGPGSQIFLISPERRLIDAVVTEIEAQLANLGRQQFLRETLNLGCFLVEVKNLAQGIQIVEDIAPEHLSLACAGAEALAPKIRNCGGIFIGPFSPVAAGDYAAGPSHELPTGGAGKFCSGLTVHEFFRRTSIVSYDRKALAKIRRTVETLAEAEGMGAHRHSVAARFAAKPRPAARAKTRTKVRPVPKSKARGKSRRARR